jgi:hypothetical protein
VMTVAFELFLLGIHACHTARAGRAIVLLHCDIWRAHARAIYRSS